MMKLNANGGLCISIPGAPERSETLRVKTADKHSVFSLTSGGGEGFSDDALCARSDALIHALIIGLNDKLHSLLPKCSRSR